MSYAWPKPDWPILKASPYSSLTSHPIDAIYSIQNLSLQSHMLHWLLVKSHKRIVINWLDQVKLRYPSVQYKSDVID